MNKFLGHLKTVHTHRKLVRQGCFRLGMYKQGLLHDLSKYSWPEFRIGIKYFRSNESPHNGEREKYGYSSAWLHHKGRNKHHMEYWIDYDFHDRHITGMKMPTKYVVEMFVDRVAASKVYKKEQYTDSSPLEYYNRKKEEHIIHKETRALLEKLLNMLAEEGEKKTFAYIRNHLLKEGY